MIDKQKLMQWIEDKQYAYDAPYDSEVERIHFKSKIDVLNMLVNDIEDGEFDA